MESLSKNPYTFLYTPAEKCRCTISKATKWVPPKKAYYEWTRARLIRPKDHLKTPRYRCASRCNFQPTYSYDVSSHLILTNVPYNFLYLLRNFAVHHNIHQRKQNFGTWRWICSANKCKWKRQQAVHHQHRNFAWSNSVILHQGFNVNSQNRNNAIKISFVHPHVSPVHVVVASSAATFNCRFLVSIKISCYSGSSTTCIQQICLRMSLSWNVFCCPNWIFISRYTACTYTWKMKKQGKEHNNV